MAKTRLSEKALYVERGYGQVEPNHLSAQRTGQIYAQLPADKEIKVLENGQFVKYDYAEGVVNFTGKGEWMLVFNEIKLYREGLADNDFALIKGDYAAQVYSPVNGSEINTAKSRNYEGVVSAADPFEPDSTNDPFIIQQFAQPKMMPDGTTMVPRVFKTNVGDIFTTNTIAEAGELQVKDILIVGEDGYLKKSVSDGDGAPMQWQVVKVYTLPDRQKAVKIMRIV